MLLTPFTRRFAFVALENADDKDKMSAGQVLAILQEQGLTVEDVTTREADLEDVFVQLTSTGS